MVEFEEIVMFSSDKRRYLVFRVKRRCGSKIDGHGFVLHARIEAEIVIAIIIIMGCDLFEA